MTQTLKSKWFAEIKTLADAYAPRAATQYIADGLFSLPSLSIVYGSPGCLKSMILADLAICVATGTDWLPPLPHETSPAAIKVTQTPVLWLDFDNGERRTANRFEALGKTYQAQETAPLQYLAMPSTGWDTTKPAQVGEAIDFILALGARFVVIDNLLTVSGGKDENAPEIAAAMVNLRHLTERTGAAVIVIHHSRKGTTGKANMGDDLRGHSSIRGAIDLALKVDRQAGSDIITLESTKTRDVDVIPFSALWTYSHKPGTKDLETARFFGQTVIGAETNADIEQAILDAIHNAGKPLNQSEIYKALKADGMTAGRDRLRTVLQNMRATMRVTVTQGAKNAILYG